MVSKRTAVYCAAAVFLMSGALHDAFSFSNGYVLSPGFWGTTTELFDSNGNIVFTWKIQQPTNGYSCYLRENGNLLRGCVAPNAATVANVDAAPQQGMLQEVNSDSKVLWSYTLADKTYMMHHDFKQRSNGNIIGVSFVTTDSADAFEAGVDRAVFSGMTDMVRKAFQAEMIFELQPDTTGGNKHKIVWQWFVMDHVVPKEQAAAHPELFNGSHPTWQKFQGQWFHINGLDYDEKNDLIVFSSRVFSEVYVIDHGTTTEQAAGHTGGARGKGGDILYRWGRPENFGATGGTTINCLHCPTWIKEGCPGAGNIMFFHNNCDPMMQQQGLSQVIEINPFDASGKFSPLTTGSPTAPLIPTWMYTSASAADSLYSPSMSTAIRMKSGNTIIHEAYPGGKKSSKNSSLREVGPTGQLLWGPFILKETDPMGYNPAKIMYYPSDYPGIQKLLKVAAEKKGNSMKGGGSKSAIKMCAGRIAFSNVAGAEISIYSLQGKRMATLRPSTDAAGVSTAAFPAGTYLVKVYIAGKEPAGRMITVAR